MVWIYGGALSNGSASAPLYAGDRLAQRGIVLVTCNYRLGVLGFLSHPELNQESTHDSSGNYGLLDQVAALNWVQRNIAAFGGDPDRVTIFGQSSGAISISALVASPLTKGLFRRAIAQSGGLFEPVELDPNFTLAGATEAGELFARRAGAKTIADLRRISAAELLKVPFSPTFKLDGHVLTKAPRDAYAAGEVNAADILIGSTADEGQIFLGDAAVTVESFNEILTSHFPSPLVWAIGPSAGATDAEARASAASFETDMRFRWNMWAWAHYATAAGQSGVYFYQFSRTPPLRAGDRYFGLGATHGMELPYVFDHLDEQDVAWTAKDRELASVIATYWTNFAKTGDPNGDGLPRWPEFKTAPGQVMILGDAIGPTSIPQMDRLQRIGTVYAGAKFVVENLYGLGVAALVAAFTMIGLAVVLVRRFKRRATFGH
jgi:para-nitrobenzyl esterase